MARPSIVFNAWAKPLLTVAVNWLLGDVPVRVADLREWQLVLPTRQAGRRLREALAWEMDQRDGALFPPLTGTPWQLVQADEKNAATELACMWHWDRVLADANLTQYRSLFPRLPENRDAAWRRQLARTLHEMRGTLAEGGLDCAAVAMASLYGRARANRSSGAGWLQAHVPQVPHLSSELEFLTKMNTNRVERYTY